VSDADGHPKRAKWREAAQARTLEGGVRKSRLLMPQSLKMQAEIRMGPSPRATPPTRLAGPRGHATTRRNSLVDVLALLSHNRPGEPVGPLVDRDVTVALTAYNGV
jgi:hypothetical protein